MESGDVVGQEIKEAGREKKSSKSWCGSLVGPTQVHRVGKSTLGEKKILAETLSKLRFFGTS
jgi:hypothetical protein